MHIWQLGYPEGSSRKAPPGTSPLGVSQLLGVCVMRTWDDTSRGIKQSFKSVTVG